MTVMGPDASVASVEIGAGGDMEVVEEERKLPAWVEDPATAEVVWSVFNDYMRGAKPYELANTYSLSVRTVYNYIDKARAELPYHVVSKAAELAEQRMQWVYMAWKLAEDIMDSQLRIDRKSTQISKLLNSAGAWLTAVEELTGARRGSGSRINIHATGEGQTAILFDMDRFVNGPPADEQPERPVVLEAELSE